MVYDWYVVGKCCGCMVWHIWLGGAAWGVFVPFVNITFAAETCKRDLCEQLRFVDLVGELHVIEVYCI